MVLNIDIRTPKDVERLNAEACRVPEVLWVHTDDGRIMVDARSLLGLYACVGMPAKLVAEDDADPNVLFAVARRAGVY